MPRSVKGSHFLKNSLQHFSKPSTGTDTVYTSSGTHDIQPHLQEYCFLRLGVRPGRVRLRQLGDYWQKPHPGWITGIHFPYGMERRKYRVVVDNKPSGGGREYLKMKDGKVPIIQKNDLRCDHER